MSENNLDEAMRNMNIEDEEEPYELPDLPKFYSTERNERSIVGRILNPDCQKVSDLILDMPRKWQIYEGVRGVALNKERFQFIFDHEHDMQRILSKGVHTYNQWAMVIYKWVPNPPEDYLRYMPVWVRMRNVPVNHYTAVAISALAAFAGHITEMAFDPNEVQRMDYVRVRVDIDTTKPLRRSKLVNLPNGSSTKIWHEYERIQKRCFSCHMLTHQQEKCPFLGMRQDKQNEQNKNTGVKEKESYQSSIKEKNFMDDSMQEEQMGMSADIGRPIILHEVLQGTRQYLLVANDPEILISDQREKSSLLSLENDPLGQRTILRIERPPIIITDLNKGKGFVFEFNQKHFSIPEVLAEKEGNKFLSASIKAAKQHSVLARLQFPDKKDVFSALQGNHQPYGGSSTVYRISPSIAGSSGTPKKTKTQRRTFKCVRQSQGREQNRKDGPMIVYMEETDSVKEKRKAVLEVGGYYHDAKRINCKVILNEGSPSSK